MYKTSWVHTGQSLGFQVEESKVDCTVTNKSSVEISRRECNISNFTSDQGITSYERETKLAFDFD